MARKRMIDPEFWSDEEVGHWSFAARLFYIGLWNFADDEGRFKAHNQLLKSQIFPYDNRLSVNKLKQELSNKIQWYTNEQTGSQYGYIRNFLKYQRIDRPQPSKLPTPPTPEIDEQSANTLRTVEANIKEVKLKEENIREGKNKGFAPPSLSDIQSFVKEKSFRFVNPESFFNFYESKGWMVGKNKMRDWHKAVAGWEAREQGAHPAEVKKEHKCCVCGKPAKTQVSFDWFCSQTCRKKKLGW